MKKAAYILLLLVLALQMGGMMLVYNIQQGIVQFGMREKLENDTSLFEKLVLTSAQYKESMINSSEIFFNSKMYDIKLATFFGDSVKLIVINDIKEEQILQKMKELANSMDPQNNNLPVKLKILISLNYLSSGTGSTFFVPYFTISSFHGSNQKILSNKPDIITPPPRLV